MSLISFVILGATNSLLLAFRFLIRKRGQWHLVNKGWLRRLVRHPKHLAWNRHWVYVINSFVVYFRVWNIPAEPSVVPSQATQWSGAVGPSQPAVSLCLSLPLPKSLHGSEEQKDKGTVFHCLSLWFPILDLKEKHCFLPCVYVLMHITIFLVAFTFLSK